MNSLKKKKKRGKKVEHHELLNSARPAIQKEEMQQDYQGDCYKNRFEANRRLTLATVSTAFGNCRI